MYLCLHIREMRLQIEYFMKIGGAGERTLDTYGVSSLYFDADALSKEVMVCFRLLLVVPPPPVTNYCLVTQPNS